MPAPRRGCRRQACAPRQCCGVGGAPKQNSCRGTRPRVRRAPEASQIQIARRMAACGALANRVLRLGMRHHVEPAGRGGHGCGIGAGAGRTATNHPAVTTGIGRAHCGTGRGAGRPGPAVHETQRVMEVRRVVGMGKGSRPVLKPRMSWQFSYGSPPAVDSARSASAE